MNDFEKLEKQIESGGSVRWPTGEVVTEVSRLKVLFDEGYTPTEPVKDVVRRDIATAGMRSAVTDTITNAVPDALSETIGAQIGAADIATKTDVDALTEATNRQAEAIIGLGGSHEELVENVKQLVETNKSLVDKIAELTQDVSALKAGTTAKDRPAKESKPTPPPDQGTTPDTTQPGS